MLHHLSPFASMLQFLNVEYIVGTLGLIGILAIVFAESGLLIGFFLPGDSLLFTAGFLVSTGLFKVNVVILIVLVFIAAVLGDSVGYVFGRRIGRKLFNRPNSVLFRQENIQRAEDFYEQYGSKTIILARFIPVVRTFAPIVAGIGKMDYKTFVTYNIIGAALWAAGITLLGFGLGHWFKSLGLDIDTVILPIAAIIIIISVAPALIHLLKDKKQRTAIWAATKLQFKKLLSRGR